MHIKIIDLGLAETVPSKQPGKPPYTQYEVTYKDLDKNKVTGKRLVSFAFPEVYEFFKHVNKDDVVSVTLEKNEKTGFWDWIAAKDSTWDNAQAQMGASNAKPSAKTFTPSAKPVSQYETREERAARQQLIIRQSSISSAIDLLQTGSSVDEVLKVASQFTDWVNRKDPIQGLIDMSDDKVI